MQQFSDEDRLRKTRDSPHVQGFPAGWTEAAWPVQGAGVTAHRGASAVAGRASACDLDKAAAARFQLIGNAVTVQARPRTLG
jgi:hypothetical protein